MNIIKITGDNIAGLKNLLVLDAARVVSAGERPVGINVNDGICYYTDSPAKYIEGIAMTTGFNEEQVIVDGVPMYRQVVSTIVAKDRPEVMNEFLKMTRKRHIVLSRDKNGYIKMIGTRLQPAQMFINKRVGGITYDDRNQMELSFEVTRKDPAYNYTINYQAVETVGNTYIGKRIFTA